MLVGIVSRAVPWLALLVCLCAIAYEAGSGPIKQGAATLGIVCAWAIVLLKLRQIKAFALISSFVFGGLGLWCLWQFAPKGEQLPALFQSQADTLKYILLYGSVVWLKVQALNSRSLNRLSDWVIGQGQAAQRLWFPLLGHWLGAGFNLAGFGLLSPLVHAQQHKQQQRQNFIAIVRGFSVATAWSPVFASIIVILATFPTLTWFDIAPPSFLLALGLFILGGLLLGRTGGVTDAFRSTCADTADTIDIDNQANASMVIKLAFPKTSLFILVLLFVSLFAFAQMATVRVTLALGVVAPVFALVWLFTPDSLNRSVRRHLSEGMMGLGSLHAEILVFAMANLLATGIGVLVATGTLWVPDPDLYWMNWLGLATAYFLIMSLGIHPLVIVLVAVNVMPAAALGVSTLTYAVLILGLWTSSTIGSPMSANNLMFSRQLGVPVWRLAWVWNMPAALLNFTTTVVLGLVLQQIARLG